MLEGGRENLPQPKNPYEILGIPENADENEIKKAYHKLVKQHHPDKNPGDSIIASEKFKEVQEAYEALSVKKLVERTEPRKYVDEAEIRQATDFGKLYKAFRGDKVILKKNGKVCTMDDIAYGVRLIMKKLDKIMTKGREDGREYPDLEEELNLYAKSQKTNFTSTFGLRDTIMEIFKNDYIPSVLMSHKKYEDTSEPEREIRQEKIE